MKHFSVKFRFNLEHLAKYSEMCSVPFPKILIAFLPIKPRCIRSQTLYKSNGIETATYSNKVYFPGEHFLYF